MIKISLTSLINNKKFKKLFKIIKPKKSKFKTLSSQRPFENNKIKVAPPLKLSPNESGKVGTAFDYLLRAQVGLWNDIKLKDNLPRVADHGLLKISESEPEIFGSPPTSISMLSDEGNLDKDKVDKLITKYNLMLNSRQSDNDLGIKIIIKYIKTIKIWSEFINGGNIDEKYLINSVWFLGNLESIFRGGNRALEYYRNDLSLLLKSPQQYILDDLLNLWDSLKTSKDFFVKNNSIFLNPNFNEASQLVGGADADIVIDNILIDIKTTKNPGYYYKDTTQIVGYYILAAMSGDPWPIKNLALYKPRFKRIEYINVKELDHKQLESFGLDLIERLDPLNSDFLKNNLKKNLSDNKDIESSSKMIKLSKKARKRKFLSAKEVSKILDLPLYTVHNYLKDNKLDGHKERGIWKIKRKSVIDYQNYISTKETSKILGKGMESIRRYIKKGKLEGKKIGGMWRISKKSIKEYKKKTDWKINRNSVKDYENSVSTKEASKILGKGMESIRRYIKKGELEGKKIDGMWRIRKKSLEEFKEKL